jgi:BirA family biotin operon repressor/biotin-[acetyl-CoA-carboxylase] ligase
VTPGDGLEPGVVEPLLRGRFGRPYRYAPSCGSTQAMLQAEDPEGAVAVCDLQTAGRGRMGRGWEAPAGAALLCSVLLKPPAGRKLPHVSLVAGVAVADTLERTLDLAVQVKWPNDVMLRRTKVAGCLAEARDGAVVLGVGVNVNQTREQLPAGGSSSAGSLRQVTGRDWPRAPLLAMFLADLERCYADWVEGGLERLYPSLGARDFLRGRRVSVDGTTGTAVMIDRGGGLRIAVEHGRVVTVESGEVSYER